MPSEMRMSKITSTGKFSLSFTNEMILPSNFTAILNLRSKKEVLNVISNTHAQIVGNETTSQDLLQLAMIRSDFAET